MPGIPPVVIEVIVAIVITSVILRVLDIEIFGRRLGSILAMVALGFVAWVVIL